MTQTAIMSSPTPITTPEPSIVTEPQRLRALERANEVRLARAELKRRIADGQVSAAEVILVLPGAARSWAVGELLTSQRRWGNTRCRKFLQRHHINETKPLGELTERQRRLLAAQLGAAKAHEFEFVGSAPELVTNELDLPLTRV
jgi:hypothetical protein